MRSERWHALLWIVGFGEFLGTSVFLLLVFRSAGEIVIAGFPMGVVLVIQLFWIQKKINEAMKREGITEADIAAKHWEKKYLEDPEMVQRHEDTADESIRKERRAHLQKIPLSEEDRKKAEQILKDWEKVEEEMK